MRYQGRAVPVVLGLVLWIWGATAWAGANLVVLDKAKVIIDSALRANPIAFADQLPFVGGVEQGTWTTSADGRTSTWSLRLQAPWAKTISVEASQLQLPRDATLDLIDQVGNRFTVTASDIVDGTWWSRTLSGTVMELEARMAADQVGGFRIALRNVYTGFRLPFSQQQAAPAGAKALVGNCAVNYTCKSGITNQGNATVAFTFRNAGACTGTLINNTAGNRRLLLLTANHCRIDEIYTDASSVVVYWNATDSCGSTLRDFALSARATSAGAATLKTVGTVSPGGTNSTSAQDAWLMELTSPVPAGITPYWAGFDAGDAIPASAYGVHHAQAQSKQYVRFGAPTKFQLEWNAVPVEGDGGDGSSGSALFDNTGKLIGTLAGAGFSITCPAPSIGYKRLGVYFDQMKAFLDPGTTGSKSVTGIGAVPPIVDVTASKTSATVGETVNLAWTVSNATSCTASGDWAGSKTSTGGSEAVSVGSTAGSKTYTLSCTGSGGTVTDAASVTVTAPPPVPTLTLSSSAASVPQSTSVTLTWASTNTTESCTASGSWSGSKVLSGSEAVNVGAAGSKTYTLACTGPGGSVTRNVSVTSVAPAPPPAITFTAPSTVVASSAINLAWSTTAATSCAATGGWTGTKGTSGSESITAPAAAGPASYTLSCTGGGGSSTETRTVQVTSAPVVPPPAPTLTVSAPPSVTAGSPLAISWTSTNATACAASDAWSGSKPVTGSETVTSPAAAGTVTYALTCNGGGGSVNRAVTVTVSAPSVIPTEEASSGGGAINPLFLFFGLALLAARRRQSIRAGNGVSHGN